MAESVDATVSNTVRETCAGSTPARSTYSGTFFGKSPFLCPRAPHLSSRPRAPIVLSSRSYCLVLPDYCSVLALLLSRPSHLLSRPRRLLSRLALLLCCPRAPVVLSSRSGSASLPYICHPPIRYKVLTPAVAHSRSVSRLRQGHSGHFSARNLTFLGDLRHFLGDNSHFLGLLHAFSPRFSDFSGQIVADFGQIFTTTER